MTTTDGNDFRDSSDFDILRELDTKFVYDQLPSIMFVCALLVMGLIGNTLAFLVYRKFSPSSTRTYILAISAVDLSTNLISYPTSLVEMSFHYTFVHAWQCSLIRFVTSAQIIASALILVAVALDRHRRVCQSLKKQQTPTDALRAVVICAIVAGVVSIPYGVMTGNATFTIHAYNMTGIMCSLDDRYEGSLFHVLYQSLTGVGMFTSLAIMCVSYTRIACHVRQHRKRMAAVDQASACHSASSGNTYTVATTLSGFHKVGASVSDEKESSHIQDQRLHSTSCPPCGGSNLSVSAHVATSEQSDLLLQSYHQQDNSPPKPGHLESPNKSMTPRLQLFALKKLKKKKTDGGGQHGQHGDKAKQMSSRTTLIMFLLTAIFIVSFMPYWATVSVRVVIGIDIHTLPLWLLNLHAIAVQSFFISSSVNALVYACCSAKFREECRHLCSCWQKRQ
ncbi:hypothetical protein C0Q70_07870 [Pomacea canaliculata]|uniref:G-protein coupled receptors family 1 profile domain-containing protein n=1 Tax=Pomacea canaliculata TaxID=400727 RepID=A0A2T7PG82_POMCA|nr:uncharacterized protein LOC112561413 [Pomacea canaliculata]PVD32436.1 hypothetical protein C0Q70_07870 [Pomacea canaliculata]